MEGSQNCTYQTFPVKIPLNTVPECNLEDTMDITVYTHTAHYTVLWVLFTLEQFRSGPTWP